MCAKSPTRVSSPSDPGNVISPVGDKWKNGWHGISSRVDKDLRLTRRFPPPRPHNRRRTYQEPHSDQLVEDHTAEGRSSHERPDGMTYELMGQVPPCMHQPGNAYGAVRPQAEVGHRNRQHWIDQLPNTKASANIGAHCACREDGIEATTRGVWNERHNDNEKTRSESRSDKVHGSKR